MTENFSEPGSERTSNDRLTGKIITDEGLNLATHAPFTCCKHRNEPEDHEDLLKLGAPIRSYADPRKVFRLHPRTSIPGNELEDLLKSDRTQVDLTQSGVSSPDLP